MPEEERRATASHIVSTGAKSTRPSKADLEAAFGATVPDVIAPGLRVLFCGINPGLYSGYTGHHFARPGNRFWTTLFTAGFTPTLLCPEDERELLPLGFGITNLVERATASAAELSAAELQEGGCRLELKLAQYEPQVLCVLGISAYRQAFTQPAAVLGEQPERLAGVQVWVLPNPSGLNAHYTPSALAEVFRQFLRVI
jgi:double-stranded uracil-DNA glycosylase